MPPTYANGHISATGDPIYFMFGFRVQLSWMADRTALFTVRTNPRWRDSNKFKMAAAAILDNFEWLYLRNGSRSILI